jgi:YHS domain-containing protein
MFYIDPVCKKRLRRKEECAILKYGGNVYHLCCKTCKEEFQKNPIQHILEGKVHTEQDREK